MNSKISILIKLIFCIIIFISFFSCLNPKDDENKRELPKLNEQQDFLESITLTIYLNENNEVFIDDKKEEIENINKFISDFVYNNKSKAVIALRFEKETMYKLYIDVQNVIIKEIGQLRNKVAIEKFAKNFQNLTEKQRDSIKATYPIKIIN